MRIAALGMAVVICCTLPSLCFALPAGASPGCHGHHRPAPQPAHSCCYAAQQIPAVVPVAPSPVGLTCINHWSSAPETSGPRAGMVRAVAIGSPSPRFPPLFASRRSLLGMQRFAARSRIFWRREWNGWAKKCLRVSVCVGCCFAGLAAAVRGPDICQPGFRATADAGKAAFRRSPEHARHETPCARVTQDFRGGNRAAHHLRHQRGAELHARIDAHDHEGEMDADASWAGVSERARAERAARLGQSVLHKLDHADGAASPGAGYFHRAHHAELGAGDCIEALLP